jgi:hypothetical protein
MFQRCAANSLIREDHELVWFVPPSFLPLIKEMNHMRSLPAICAAVAAAVLLTAASASAQTIRLAATLTGSEEAPNRVNSGAFGSAEVIWNTVTQEGSVTVTVFNLPSGTTGGHIHVGGRDTAGPIIWDLRPTANVSNDFVFSLTINAGNLTLRPDQGIRSFEDAVQALLGGNTYVNVHSQVNTGGEIRGHLTRQ